MRCRWGGECDDSARFVLQIRSSSYARPESAGEGGTTKGDVIRFFGRTNLTGSQEGSFSETMEPMPKSSCYSPGGNDVTRINAPPHRTTTCFHRDRIADLQLLPPGLVPMNPALNIGMDVVAASDTCEMVIRG